MVRALHTALFCVLLVLALLMAEVSGADKADADSDEKRDAKPTGEMQCPDGGGNLQSPIALGNEKSNKKESGRRDRDRERVGEGRAQQTAEPKPVTEFYANKYYGKLRDRFYAKNDGQKYYFQFHPTEQTSEMTVRGKSWDDEYVLAMGRFHWGSNNSNGSEHVIHGETFPLELQLIHYRKSDGKLEDARKKKDGVVILSILYEIDEERPNPVLNSLVQGAKSVYFPGPLKQIHGPVRLKSLFPLQMAYFEYTGSFTSPPCDEGVKWVVFEEPQVMSSSQLEILRKLVFGDGEPMVNNFRPLQSTNNQMPKHSGKAVLKIQLKTSLSFAVRSKMMVGNFNVIFGIGMLFRVFMVV